MLFVVISGDLSYTKIGLDMYYHQPPQIHELLDLIEAVFIDRIHGEFAMVKAIIVFAKRFIA